MTVLNRREYLRQPIGRSPVREAIGGVLRAMPIGGARAGVLGAVGVDAIPDSAIHEYEPDNFTTSNWPDEVGTSDIATITGLSFDSSAFSSTGGVTGDGTDDNGLSDSMGTFGSNLDTDFAISIPVNTTDDAVIPIGVSNSGTTTHCYLTLGDVFSQNWTAGSIGLFLRDQNSDDLAETTDTAYNDGNDYHILVNKTGNTAGDINVYADDMTTAVATTNQRTGFGSPVDFDESMGYFARNFQGSTDNYFAGTMGRVIWFDNSLSESERQDVHDSLDWT